MKSLITRLILAFSSTMDLMSFTDIPQSKRSRLTVVSREAKEEAARGALTDSRLTCTSILQEQELCKSKMP